MKNNWCIRLTDLNRDIVVGYFNKQYVANYSGIIGSYYGCYDNDCSDSNVPFGTEITTHDFIGKIKSEGYNVGFDTSTNKYCFVENPILSTSTNNPPINNFLVELDKDTKEVQGTPSYYDNSKGSLYQFAEHHKLNAWEFDIVKRVVRCREKGNFTEDLEKTKKVIDLYLKEFKP